MTRPKPERKVTIAQLQQRLWNRQHTNRGTTGQEGNELKFAPNSLALEIQLLLPDLSTILEIGCANGRDARFFASFGHNVIALDFSEVALAQMMDLAKQQGCATNIKPIHHDINHGLPTLADASLNCMYARSALHIDDSGIIELFKQLNIALCDTGLIAIEGKGERDLSIQGSEALGDNLAVNWLEGGHLRRVWTEEFCIWLAQAFSWDILTLDEMQDELFEKYFLRFIAKKSLLEEAD